MTIPLSFSAADFQSQIDILEAEVSVGTSPVAITLTDATTPTITLNSTQYKLDGTVLGDIVSAYKLDITNVVMQNVAADLLNTHVAAVSVVDTGITIGQNLDQLESMTKAGTLLSIRIEAGSAVASESTASVLSATGAQLTSDSAAIAKITGSYDVEISAQASQPAVTGLTGHGNFVNFSGNATAYTLTPSTDGQSLAVAGGGSTWTLNNVQALNFADGTFLFVAQTPGDASHVTTGNVTELYSAVLAREPDLGGLTFYQNYLSANPTTSLQQFAEFFLSSTEYTSAHSYAQTTAGETQFIDDSYQNLLHRTPSASEVNYYLTNVLEQPGTQLQNHAQMLVYFSASSEFLSDVQVTASNPASAQHWLVLI